MLFSVRFGVCLTYLTILLILPEQGRPQCYSVMPRSPGLVVPPCCTTAPEAPIREPVFSCCEQNETTFSHCKIHAFIFTTANGTHYCVDPKAKWLPRRFQYLKKRGICCYRL